MRQCERGDGCVSGECGIGQTRELDHFEHGVVRANVIRPSAAIALSTNLARDALIRTDERRAEFER